MPYSTFFAVFPLVNEKQGVQITRQKLEIVRNDVDNAAFLFPVFMYLSICLFIEA